MTTQRLKEYGKGTELMREPEKSRERPTKQDTNQLILHVGLKNDQVWLTRQTVGSLSEGSHSHPPLSVLESIALPLKFPPREMMDVSANSHLFRNGARAHLLLVGQRVTHEQSKAHDPECKL